MKTKDKRELSNLRDLQLNFKSIMSKREYFRMKELEQIANRQKLNLIIKIK